MEARYKVAIGVRVIKPIQQASFKKKEKETLHTHTRTPQLTANGKIVRTPGPREGYIFYSPNIVSHFIVMTHKAYELLIIKSECQISSKIKI